MKIIFIYAHPDDESFSAGGTISLLTKKGITVKLITLTKGEKGRPGDPPITTQEKLGEVREKELRNAAKILGIEQIHFLGFTDGELDRISSKKLSNEIYKILKEEKPDVVVTFNKEGGSRHPDHIKTSKCSTMAFGKYLSDTNKHVRLYYSTTPRSFVNRLRKAGLTPDIYGKVHGTPDSHITTAVNISAAVETKVKALMEHKTQHRDWERYVKRKDYKEFKYEFFKLVVENKLV